MFQPWTEQTARTFGRQTANCPAAISKLPTFPAAPTPKRGFQPAPFYIYTHLPSSFRIASTNAHEREMYINRWEKSVELIHSLAFVTNPREGRVCAIAEKAMVRVEFGLGRCSLSLYNRRCSIFCIQKGVTSLRMRKHAEPFRFLYFCICTDLKRARERWQPHQSPLQRSLP